MSIENIKIKLVSAGQGFNITLFYGEETQDGFLPDIPPTLDQTFKDWQSTYRQLEDVRTHFRISGATVTRYSRDESSQYASAVESLFNQWLSSTERRWQEIRDALVFIFGRFGREVGLVPILLDTSDTTELSRLPWQAWDLLSNRDFKTELILRVRERLGNSIKPVIPQAKVQMLVLVGCTEGLNVSQDLAIIKSLESTQNTEVTLLTQPTKEELQNTLRARAYHLFIFIGHSCSDQKGEIGWLQLNKTQSISIEDFKLAFKKVIDQGLQLAIFNSCDGLGLAHQLAELNLPRCIVMREPVPDTLAAAFLNHFLSAFSQNQSLFAALHEAREQLEYAKSEYPGILWLPILCIRESALKQSFTWKEMIASNPPGSAKKNRVWLLGAVGLAIFGIVTAAIFGPRIIGDPNDLSTISPDQDPSLLPESDPVLGVSSSETFAGIAPPSGSWWYGGSTTWAPIRGEIDPKIMESHPGFELVYKFHPTLPEGSGTGIQMLLNEQISFAQSSRPLANEEYDIARRRGFDLEQVPVAVDAIAFAVHPDLEVDSLSIQELQAIYTGTVTNWQEVGGPDLSISAYSRPVEAGGTPEFFVENILEGANLGDAVELVNSTTQGIQKVALNPGGIYYASAPELVPQCSIAPLPISQGNLPSIPPYAGEKIPSENCPAQRNQVNLEAIQTGDYPLTRRLFVIVKQQGRDEEAGRAYADLLLTDEGQALIREAGFIPLR